MTPARYAPVIFIHVGYPALHIFRAARGSELTGR
jgi:hypothetical protein